MTAQGKVTQLTPREFGITNTMGWTRDGRFLTADTLRNEIYAYDVVDGDAAPTSACLPDPTRAASPDGSCLDDDDALWNCRVAGGAGLIRYARDGSQAAFVDLPCTWPTSCAFGGAQLNELYVTSARFTMSAERLREHPQEGGLFRVRPGVRGRAEPRFG